MKEVVLGLLGLGNIGGGVWDLIRTYGDDSRFAIFKRSSHIYNNLTI